MSETTTTTAAAAEKAGKIAGVYHPAHNAAAKNRSKKKGRDDLCQTPGPMPDHAGELGQPSSMFGHSHHEVES